MSTLSSVREIARAEAPSFSFGRALGAHRRVGRGRCRGSDQPRRARKSRRQLAELDDRLLRDIGLDRGTARYEATKGFWA